MLMERSRPTLTLAGALLAAAFVATAVAGPPTQPSCDGTAMAAEYDRKADDYAAAAERYRTWASAEGMFRSDIYGSEWDFQQQAHRMDLAAERSRALAAEVRGRSTPSDTCGADTTAGTNG
jgi:hypothetical protein